MSDISEILINVERERYKLIEEMKRFEMLKEEFERLNVKAESDPGAAQCLDQFHKQYGTQFLLEVTNIMTQVKIAETQYKSLQRMVNSNPTSAVASTQSVSPPVVPLKEKKAADKHYI
ncbi:hypothetical protein [Citrobacter youngae]|uniref:Uncharacterized protein n=1 Tax=Citrobacter youngae ATCC 29220 TaxID=500640 RepID=D4BKF3_9ENTR|nr:hypothetical protein [Citrobacter youngae]EFE05584.1 hypothetical protein CIT292_11030 [Citrobacter youngae ATCC 29220]